MEPTGECRSGISVLLPFQCESPHLYGEAPAECGTAACTGSRKPTIEIAVLKKKLIKAHVTQDKNYILTLENDVG
jgi:hypothetical protein